MSEKKPSWPSPLTIGDLRKYLRGLDPTIPIMIAREDDEGELIPVARFSLRTGVKRWRGFRWIATSTAGHQEVFIFLPRVKKGGRKHD